MKKTFYILSILVFAIILTGCGKGDTKHVFCGKLVQDDELPFTINYNVDVTDNKVSSFSLRYDYDVSGYSESEIQELNAEDGCAIIKNGQDEGIFNAATKCNQRLENNNGIYLVIEFEFDVSKITNSTLTGTKTPEDIKNSMEQQGFGCNIW